MASKVLHGHDFPNGTLVAAYPRENLVNGGPPSGTAVDTDTVVAGSLTFDGLTEGRRYVAYAAGQRPWSFFMEPGSLDQLRPINGLEAQEVREAVDAVEAVEGSVDNLDDNVKARNIKDVRFGPSVLNTQGAIGDGSSHLLSGFFANLAAAQAVYPHATALTNELDWAAAQKAINEGGIIESPEGSFKFERGFQFPVTAEGAVSFIGKGPEKTKWTMTAGATGYAVTIGDGGVTDARRQAIVGMTIVGNATADGGLRLNHSRFSGATEVQFYDFTKAGATGVSTTAGGAQAHNYFALISHCRFKNIPIAIAFTSTGNIGGNSNYVQFCHFQQHSTAAVQIDGSAADILLGNEFGATIAIAVRLQGGARHSKIIGNQFDGPTLTVDLDPATVLDTNLLGNTNLGSVTSGGAALTGAQYVSTRTVRVDTEGLALPAIIQGGLEVGNYPLSNPTDGIGSLGAIRSADEISAYMNSASEMRLLTGFFQGSEIADPAAPAANKGRLYFRDNGSGKTQLVVRFPTGAIQVVATEP